MSNDGYKSKDFDPEEFARELQIQREQDAREEAMQIAREQQEAMRQEQARQQQQQNE